MYKLWKVADNGELVVNVEEMKLYKHFRNLWVIGTQVRGDVTGKGKKFNKAAFKFIWFYADLRSPFFGEPNDSRFIHALVASDLQCCLEKDIDPLKADGNKLAKVLYKMVPDLLRCIKLYEEVQDSYDVKILRGLKEGLYNGNLLVDYCNATIGKAMLEHKRRNDDVVTETTMSDDEFDNALLKSFKALEDIIKLSEKIPEAIDRITIYEEKVMAKVSNVNLAQGGKKVGNRATPKT